MRKEGFTNVDDIDLSEMFVFLANYGGCPFAETDPVWEDPKRFFEEVSKLMEQE